MTIYSRGLGSQRPGYAGKCSLDRWLLVAMSQSAERLPTLGTRASFAHIGYFALLQNRGREGTDALAGTCEMGATSPTAMPSPLSAQIPDKELVLGSYQGDATHPGPTG